MLPSPEAQSDPTEDSTTTSGRPRGKLSSPHQIGLALFGRVAGLRTPPPDRALWREATELILRTVDLGSLQVSELLVQHVLWGLYFLADAAGRVTGYTEPDLASAMHCSRRQVHNVLQIVSGIAVRRTRKSRRAPVEYHLNLGGLDWPAVRRRAALEWRDRLRGSRGLEPEPGGLEIGPSHAGAAPLSPAGAAPLGPSHAGAAPLSPAGAAPLGPSHAGAAPLSPAGAAPLGPSHAGAAPLSHAGAAPRSESCRSCTTQSCRSCTTRSESCRSCTTQSCRSSVMQELHHSVMQELHQPCTGCTTKELCTYRTYGTAAA